VSPSNYVETLEEQERRGRKLRLNLYESNTQTLIITIPTQTHEMLHSALHWAYTRSLPLNLQDQWISMGGPTHKTGSEYAPTGGGEGDSTGSPRNLLGPNCWPTLVIEGGYSQTLAALHHKMRWWFSASNHAVQIVILIKLDMALGTITIQRYQEEPARTRQGATNTRYTTTLQPFLMQEIRITRTATDPIQSSITSGDLNLPFKRLFRRDPTPQEPENVVVTVAQLRDYATDVWTVIG
jgi:hypothetical protein